MQQEPQAVAAIRGTGHRLTTQRVIVMEAIRELGGHVKVDQIAKHVGAQHPYIDQATVYRTVGLLSRLHLVNEIQVGGVTHYEFANPAYPHLHMVCEHCGGTFHLPADYLNSLAHRLMRDMGFSVHTQHLTISGLCADCRQDESHSHSGHSHTQSQSHSHPAL